MTASRRVVIRCEGQTFIAGADITEFQRSKPPQAPDFNAVLNKIEWRPSR
jgi:enoyl-CoA hydratase/carnithine racemase